jgi:hypothetical protein
MNHFKPHVYLIMQGSKDSIRRMATDLALDLEISVEESQDILWKQLKACGARFEETKGVVHLKSDEVKTKVEELLGRAENLDPDALRVLLISWLNGDNAIYHYALFSVMYSGFKDVLLTDNQVLSCCLFDEEILDFGNLHHELSPNLSNGWVRDGDEVYPIFDCLAAGQDYIVWHLYPENTRIPILGFFDFSRNCKIDSLLALWLDQSSKKPIARVVREMMLIEYSSFAGNQPLSLM